MKQWPIQWCSFRQVLLAVSKKTQCMTVMKHTAYYVRWNYRQHSSQFLVGKTICLEHEVTCSSSRGRKEGHPVAARAGGCLRFHGQGVLPLLQEIHKELQKLKEIYMDVAKDPWHKKGNFCIGCLTKTSVPVTGIRREKKKKTWIFAVHNTELFFIQLNEIPPPITPTTITLYGPAISGLSFVSVFLFTFFSYTK